jgi:hypothetical protein
MLEERRTLLVKISSEQKRKGWAKMSSSHEERAEGMEEHINRLKELLFSLKKPVITFKNKVTIIHAIKNALYGVKRVSTFRITGLIFHHPY